VFVTWFEWRQNDFVRVYMTLLIWLFWWKTLIRCSLVHQHGGYRNEFHSVYLDNGLCF